MEAALAELVGLLYALILGHCLTCCVVATARDGDGSSARSPHPAMVGYIERTIVFGAWMLGRPELAGAWLVLKAAATWQRWEKERAVYNVFLIGTGLSVILATIGALIVPSITHGDWAHAATWGGSGILLGVLLSVARRRPFDWLFTCGLKRRSGRTDEAPRRRSDNGSGGSMC